MGIESGPKSLDELKAMGIETKTELTEGEQKELEELKNDSEFMKYLALYAGAMHSGIPTSYKERGDLQKKMEREHPDFREKITRWGELGKKIRESKGM